VTGVARVSSPLGEINPGQYCIHSDALIPGWQQLLKNVHAADYSKIAMQIARGGVVSYRTEKHYFTPLTVSALLERQRPHAEMTDVVAGRGVPPSFFHIGLIHRVRTTVGGDFPLLIKSGLMDEVDGSMPLSKGWKPVCRWRKQG
jgi:hypothetical protein